MTPTADKVHGTVSTAREKELSGSEFVPGLANGILPLNAIARTLGHSVIEASNGRVTVAAEPNLTLLHPAGTVHGGFSRTLLDSRMGLAIHSTHGRRIGLTTLESEIHLVRSITTRTGKITAEGAVLSRGRRIATAKKEMTNHNRRVLTHGTANCLTFEH